MVECPSCKSILENDESICELCGYNLSSQGFEPSSNDSDIRCYICNNRAEGSCSKCGREVCKVHLTAKSKTGPTSGMGTSYLCSICAKKVSDVEESIFKLTKIVGVFIAVFFVIFVIFFFLVW